MGWTKYRNKKVVVDGIQFDSKREANRYSELLLLEKSGAITDLKRQVKFTLLPSQYIEVYENGKIKNKCIERPCTYVADFTYIDNETKALVVEDTKGFKTKDYVIKRKLMLYIHKIRITEI